MIAVICGGVGAARFLTGLVQVVDPHDIVAVVNTGDDLELHGLSISPDIDTVTYTLAGAVNPETGWGLAGETFQALEALESLGGETWFRLGDRDLGTHLYRTERLQAGARLSEVTAEIAQRRGVGVRIVPMSDDPVRTRVRLQGGEEIAFQEYFVKLGHSVPIAAVRFDRVQRASPAPGVIEALEAADAVIVAPSNPVVSIGPVLAVPGIASTLERRRSRVVAVSPIVGGQALKGPADRMLVELGYEASVTGVAEILATVAGTLVIDEVDRALAGEVERAGLGCVVTDTVMREPAIAAALARTCLAAVGVGP